MDHIPKFMYIGLDDESSAWRVNFDETLIQDLVEDGWIELIRSPELPNSSEPDLHRLYNPVKGNIKYISWNE